MTTIKELICLLDEAGKKLGYDMPVIPYCNVDCADSEYASDSFVASDILNGDIPDIYLHKRQAQSDLIVENQDEVECGFDWLDLDDEKLKLLIDKPVDVLMITSPIYKYGKESNKF